MTEKPLTPSPLSTARQRIGLIGAGRMGTGIGISLLRHGIELHVKANKDRIGADRLIGTGACEQASIAELARHVDAVVLSLPSSQAKPQYPYRFWPPPRKSYMPQLPRAKVN